MTVRAAVEPTADAAVGGVAWIVAAALLVVAATVAMWPAGAALRRLHGRPAARRPSLPNVDLAGIRARAEAFAERSPRRALGVSALVGAVPGGIVAGPVGGFVLATYGALAVRAAIRWSARSRHLAMRARSLDDLVALAADLRAGLAGQPAGAGAATARPTDARLAELTAAVWRLAEQTGAPAADLIDRIEADARSADRARAGAAAEAAGAQATALMMAVLPAGGIALGYGIGFDPLPVLLHTPHGAACAIGAVLLQGAGLLWSDRLANGPAR